MKVFFLCDLICLWAMKMVLRMRRWSEGSRMSVVQVAELVKWVGMIVRSGDVGCCLCRWVGGGNLVGLSSLIME